MGVRSSSMSRPERARRFWRAHGRSLEQLTLLHAFANNPALVWTPDGLCCWYEIRIDKVRAILADFAGSGIVQREGERADRYRWNPRLDWVVPSEGIRKEGAR